VSFLPSVDGFGFSNSWPDEPAVVVPTPFGRLALGNAAAGLCGGMVFAALDYWHAHLAAPAARPAGGSPLYAYIVKRLIDSWHLPAGVAQYYHWMNVPDGDSGFDVLGHHVVTERGLGWRTVVEQWPLVRASLDAGTPVPLGLVTVASARPKDLGRNHQVLAYGYSTQGAAVTIRVYDPNQAGRDDVTLAFDGSAPTRPTAFPHTLAISEPVRGFFATAYAPATPPTAT
jgi:hypothetical protein